MVSTLALGGFQGFGMRSLMALGGIPGLGCPVVLGDPGACGHHWMGSLVVLGVSMSLRGA